MRILIVSHNCFDRRNNMGKTLLSYFRGFQPEELAQFYIQNTPPAGDSLCRDFYRFTDLDAVRALLFRRSSGGRIMPGEAQGKAAVSHGLLHQFGDKRTVAGMLLRELVWASRPWDAPDFWEWVADFGPEVVFFAAGDYGFSYDIARRVSERTGAALAVCCVDDHYLHNRNAGSLPGRLLHRRFLRTVQRTMDRARWIFTISQSLQREYTKLFQKDCRILHTPALAEEPDGAMDSGISYLGWLELGRPEQLVAIGRTLKALALPQGPNFLDVYAQEGDPRALAQMTEENGIRFHGGVSPEEVVRILGRSRVVVHTESFAEEMQNIVRHSVSAKIPDALRNGGCILAYGPEGVASIDYLKQHGAAFCITRPEDLADGLRTLLTEDALRREIVARARDLAAQNHGMYAGTKLLRQCFGEVLHEDPAN